MLRLVFIRFERNEDAKTAFESRIVGVRLGRVLPTSFLGDADSLQTQTGVTTLFQPRMQNKVGNRQDVAAPHIQVSSSPVSH